MHYRAKLAELLAFVDRQHAFDSRAEAIAAKVDQQIAGLHPSWDGAGAAAHIAMHQEWISAAQQMRDALAHLRDAAHRAHGNQQVRLDNPICNRRTEDLPAHRRRREESPNRLRRSQILSSNTTLEQNGWTILSTRSTT
ncbi:hypothetical protein DVS77_30050 [Mycolicibacterium moriokaense]|nr:hypothetical protein DVS77_30050 [Mycolicibacterium moriokaense]